MLPQFSDSEVGRERAPQVGDRVRVRYRATEFGSARTRWFLGRVVGHFLGRYFVVFSGEFRGASGGKKPAKNRVHLLNSIKHLFKPIKHLFKPIKHV